MSNKFEDVIRCPHCHKGEITVLVIRPYLAHHTSHISSGGHTSYHKTDETFKVLSDKCGDCGATRGEMDRALNMGESKSITGKEVAEKARISGLPTQITWS